MTSPTASTSSFSKATAAPRPKFSELPLERQLLASAAFADHLLATQSIDTTVSRDELIAKCHELLLLLPDETFDQI